MTFTAPSAGPYYVFVQPFQGDSTVATDARSLSIGWSVITSNGEFSGSDLGGGRTKGCDYTLTISDATQVATTTPPAFLAGANRGAHGQAPQQETNALRASLQRGTQSLRGSTSRALPGHPAQEAREETETSACRRQLRELQRGE